MEMICKEGQLLFIKWVIDVESRQFPSKSEAKDLNIMQIGCSN